MFSPQFFSVVGVPVFLSRVTLVFLAAVFTGAAAAQPANVRFDHLSTQDGLSHAEVYAILQDRHGFMWFGTKNGLDRYDGHSFRSFRHDPTNDQSLSDNWISALLEDGEGNIWIGTRNAGLNVLQAGSRTIVRFPFQNELPEKGLLSGQVNDLLLDTEGSIWIATNGGLSRLDPRDGQFSHILNDSTSAGSLPSNDIETIFEDSRGDIWIASWKDGVCKLDPETNQIAPMSNLHAEVGRITSRVRAINEDSDGNLLLGTASGFIVWNLNSNEFHRYRNEPQNPSSISENNVWALHEDARGKIWVGTYGGGINRFDPESGTFARFVDDPSDSESLANNVVDALMEDRTGMLWIATENGVDRYDLNRENFTHFTNDPESAVRLSSNDVRAVKTSSIDPYIVWLGTSRGLNRVNRELNRVTSFQNDRAENDPEASPLIFEIDEDSGGRIWMGSPDAGVAVFNPKSGELMRFQNRTDDLNSLSSNAVHALVVGKDGYVWIGTDGAGLNRLDPGNGHVLRIQSIESDPRSISDNNISSLFQGSDGSLWIGTYDSGVSLLDPENMRLERIDLTQAGLRIAAFNRITSFAESMEGSMWIGTFGGLIRIRDGVISAYTSVHGLAEGAVLGLAAAKNGDLWLTTNSGLSRFTVESESFINFGLLNGLPDLQYAPGALSVSTRGIVSAGGRNGYLEFPESSLTANASAPPLVMTDLLINGSVVRSDVFPGETIELSHRDGLFSFDFALLDYASPENHIFQITLSDFENGNRFSRGAAGRAEYTNVSSRSGDHVLVVQATADGINWTESTFHVTIAPPWWRTPLSLTLFVLVFSCLVGVTVWFATVKRKMNALEKRQMLAEGREKERLLITRVIHDAPLQNLYAVQHKLELLEDVIPPENRDNGLTSAKALILQTGQELRSLIGDLRPPTIGPFGLEPAITDHVQALANTPDILTIHTEFHGDSSDLPDQLRLTLFRIYQGAISNVIRHAEAANAWVILRFDVASVRLEIRDDGKGFRQPNNWMSLARNKQYGILGISEWAESAGGTLQVRSALGKGTQIAVIIPREASVSVRLHRQIARLTRLFSKDDVSTPSH